MRRLDYYFRETLTGLRRNGLVAFAAIATAFIAMLLFGMALLIRREFELIIEATTGNVEISIYLADPVKQDTVDRLTTKLLDLPVVASVDYETKEEAYERFVELFKNQDALVNNTSPDALPASLKVKLSDPERFPEVAAALACKLNPDGEYECAEPGILKFQDHHDTLKRLFKITNLLQFTVLTLALLMLVFSTALIANTIRVGLFARRKEIAIMKLVGATNWRIRIPFLIEALVESVLGAGFAVVLLFAGKVLVIDGLRQPISFLPLIGNDDVLAAVPWLLAVSAAVAVVAGTIGMRRFLDV